MHTVYGGAHLFREDTFERLGRNARKLLDAYAPDYMTLAEALDDPGLPPLAYERMCAKLAREPVEDYRIDFEDGYGQRDDVEEDQHARAAGALASSIPLPPFFGIRIKALTPATRTRALRTLNLFNDATQGQPFIITLPKVTSPAQVKDLLAWAPPVCPVELMIETPEAILESTGRYAIPALLDAAAGRCRALHFGAYDYTASLGITAEAQSLDHPACDFARSAMQVTAASRVALSDGATGLMPVPLHRGDSLEDWQHAQNRRAIHAAMRDHYRHTRRSLRNGFYQGWDLHPGQLPTRYAAVYSFFLSGFDAGADRLRNFLDRAGQATTAGIAFDDAATGQGLLNFMLRGVNCGAFDADTVSRRTGVTLSALQSGSFTEILAARKATA